MKECPDRMTDRACICSALLVDCEEIGRWPDVILCSVHDARNRSTRESSIHLHISRSTDNCKSPVGSIYSKSALIGILHESVERCEHDSSARDPCNLYTWRWLLNLLFSLACLAECSSLREKPKSKSSCYRICRQVTFHRWINCLKAHADIVSARCKRCIC